MKGRKGFTLVEIMIVVAIIGIIIAIAIPGFLRAREVSRARACAENLMKVEGSKEQYALEKNVAASASAPSWADMVGATLYLKREPECPGGGTYTIGNFATAPVCDYAEPSWLTDEDIAHTVTGKP